MKRRLLIGGLLLAAGLAAVIATLHQRAGDLVAARLAEATGQPVRIGALTLSPGLRLRLKLDRLTIGPQQRPLLRATTLRLALPWSALFGRGRPAQVELVEPLLDLTLTGAEGTGGPRLRPPALPGLTVRDGRFRVRHPGRDLLLQGSAASDAEGRLRIVGEGRYGQRALRLHLLAAPGADGWEGSAVLTAGSAVATGRGHLTPVAGELELAAGGADLPALLGRIHPLLAQLPAAGGSARLRLEQEGFQFDRIDLQLGASQVTGAVSGRSGRPLRLSGELWTDRLAFPGPGGEQGGRPARFPLALRHADLDLRITAERVGLLHPPLALGPAELTLSAREGVVNAELHPHGQGPERLQGELRIDLNPEPPTLKLQLTGERLTVAPWIPGDGDAVRGQFAGRIRLAGSGAGPGAVLAGGEGELTLVLRDGRIDARAVERIGQALEDLLDPGPRKGQTVALRCAVADFRLEQGRLITRSLLFAAPETLIRGDGHVDLTGRRWALTLQGEPREGVRLSPQAPIEVSGPLGAPRFEPQEGSITGKAAGALALGALVNPLAALAPFLAIGEEGDPCAELPLGG